MKKVSILTIAALFCSLFSGCGFTVHFNRENAGKNYSVGTYTYDAADIEAVNIDWVSGWVKLVESDSAELKAQETDGGLFEEQKMRCSVDGRTLNIKFCKPGYVGTFLPGTKQLTVEIPKGTKITVESSSAEITLEAEEPKSVKLCSTSGEVKTCDFSADKVYINSTSGGISLGKVFSESDIEVYTTSGGIKADTLSAKENIFAESTSGSIRIDCAEAVIKTQLENTSGGIKAERIASPEFSAKTTSGGVFAGLLSCENAKISSGSGSVKIDLLEKLGATVRYKSTSGRFDHGDCYLSEDKYIFGSGACRIDVSTTSGGIKIK